MRFRTVVVDPPWAYNDKLRSGNSGFGRQRLTRGAANHYQTMDFEALRALPVGDWAEEDAHLYVWVTNAFLGEGLQLVREWGFQQKTMLTWVKTQIGMGHYYRNNTEHVLFAVRGRLKTLRKNVPTSFSARRGKHSQKPELLYDIVETMSPGPYLDVFARRQRLNWETWGDECFVADGLPEPQGGLGIGESVQV